MVLADTIDGARPPPRARVHHDPGSAAAQVAQQEGDRQPIQEPRLGGRQFVETPLGLGRREPEGCDGMERDHQLPLTSHTGARLEPVPPQTADPESPRRAVHELDHERLGSVVPEQRKEPLPEREAPTPQPFLLQTDTGVVRVELVIELTGEVVEQAVPAHTPTLAPARLTQEDFSTDPSNTGQNQFHMIDLTFHVRATDSARTDRLLGGNMSTVAKHHDAEQTEPSPGVRPVPALPERRTREPRATARLSGDEFFAQQPVSSAHLPDPRPLLENLTRSVIEVIAGARDLTQLARWITADVHSVLVRRVILAERARRVRGVPGSVPMISIGTITISEPRDGVVESVVMVHGRARSRAVAIRLEGLDGRWRATSVSVL